MLIRETDLISSSSLILSSFLVLGLHFCFVVTIYDCYFIIYAVFENLVIQIPPNNSRES